ncbi:MAG: hypothetical protein HC853_05240 [Anaerolineae bacterium]|nr:hypothetical protein [Anaerolineae bacterium]
MLVFDLVFAGMLILMMIGEKSPWRLLTNTKQVFAGIDILMKSSLPVVFAALALHWFRAPKRDELTALLYVWLAVTSLPQLAYILIRGETAGSIRVAMDAIPGMLWITVVANVAICICALVLARKSWPLYRWRAVGLAAFGLIVIALSGSEILMK